MKNLVVVMLMVVYVFGVSACGFAKPNLPPQPKDGESIGPSVLIDSYKMAVGDKVTINVWKNKELSLSPHFLCHTDQHFIKMAYEWREQVSDILNGKIPEKLVNREVWDSPRLQAKIKRLRAE